MIVIILKIFKICIMKKLLFLTTFFLTSLYSYSQLLTVINDSQYTITVGAVEGIDPDCSLGSGNILSLAPNTTGTIATNDNSYDWTAIRAGITGTGLGLPPVEEVVSESSCSFSCVTSFSGLLNATWNGCYEVTIDD